MHDLDGRFEKSLVIPVNNYSTSLGLVLALVFNVLSDIFVSRFRQQTKSSHRDVNLIVDLYCILHQAQLNIHEFFFQIIDIRKLL